MTKLQAQEQAEDSSGAPPDYEGRIGLDPILLDVERLVAALETGMFELSNTRSIRTSCYITLAAVWPGPPFSSENSAIWLEELIAQRISLRSVGEISSG